MRRSVGITMTVLFLAVTITGFTVSPDSGPPGIHATMAITFITSTIIHVVINRKAFVRYFLGKTLKAEQPASHGK